ncbi:hypothetical protein BJ165DRAFT_1494477 [Panaeolus papilionaceus]|nr:hypothetical protein BJ165DRAFT_1494477 [Panaeolus papilionaceus]
MRMGGGWWSEREGGQRRRRRRSRRLRFRLRMIVCLMMLGGDEEVERDKGGGGRGEREEESNGEQNRRDGRRVWSIAAMDPRRNIFVFMILSPILPLDLSSLLSGCGRHPRFLAVVDRISSPDWLPLIYRPTKRIIPPFISFTKTHHRWIYPPPSPDTAVNIATHSHPRRYAPNTSALWHSPCSVLWIMHFSFQLVFSV